MSNTKVEESTQTSISKPVKKDQLKEDSAASDKEEEDKNVEVNEAKKTKRGRPKGCKKKTKKAEEEGGTDNDETIEENAAPKKMKKKPEGEENSAQNSEEKPKKRGRKKKGDTEDEEDDTKSKSKKKRAAKDKGKEEKKSKKKKDLSFKKGKFNNLVSIVTFEKEREEKSDSILTTCCVRCSNRNVIRAVLTNNIKLLKECATDNKKISSLFDTWSAEIGYNSFYYAMTTNNIPMVYELLQSLKRIIRFARLPNYLISFLDTGMVSDQAYGTHIRKVQMARGNRQGNNAFLEKTDVSEMIIYGSFDKILENPKLEVATLEKLLVLEPNYDATINQSIIFAINAGNRKTAAYLIGRIKALQNYGFNDLHYNVLNMDGEDLPEFHKASVHKKAIENCQVTPTHCACINPNVKYLQAMLDAGADLQLMDSMNRKLIHYAAACEDSGPLELLIKRGANLNDLDNHKFTVLHYAAMYGRAKNIALLLEQAPNLLKSRDSHKMLPLHYACQNGHLEAVRAFIDKKATLSLGAGMDRISPLGFAAANNHYDVCDLLMNNKCKVIGKDKYKRTPLTYAVRNGNTKVASLLLQHGSLVDEPDSSGNSPLHYAVAYGWMECAELLLKYGANVNANSSWKITPINIAMLKNHFGMVKFLLNQPGINVNCKDEQGRTLISLAVELNNDDSLEYIEYLLKEKGADPNIPDISGETPLHHLVSKRINQIAYSLEDGHYLTEIEQKEQNEILQQLRKKIITLLLKYKADINVIDKNGKTLFDKCLDSQNFSLLDLFTSLVSFNVQPLLLFSFSSLIYNPKIKTTFDYLYKNSKMTKNTMNIMDTNGYTPFLKYIKDFLENAESYYQNIYSYIEFRVKTLKYEGAQYFNKETLKIQYDNYMNRTSQQDNNYYNIMNYVLFPGDYKAIKEFTIEEFRTTFIKTFIQILKDFLDCGADPHIKVGKLRLYREPTASDLLLSQSQQLNPVNIGNLPAKIQMMLPQPIAQTTFTKPVEYCQDGLNNAWHFVARKPLKELIELLDPLNIPIDDGNWLGNTPFMEFVVIPENSTVFDAKAMYEHLRSRKVDIDKPNSKGITPFLKLISVGSYFYAFQLAAEGINVNVNDEDNNFALKYVVMKNDVNNTKALVETYKADINKKDKLSRTVLHYAINNSSPRIDSTSEMENLLLDYGADVNACDIRGRTPLHYSFVKINNWQDYSVIDPIEVVTTLCSKKEINIDVQDAWGKSPLHYAAQRSSTISSIFLLNRGANLERKDKYGNTPLAIAFLYSHPDYAITLIERNANVSELVNPEIPEPEIPKKPAKVVPQFVVNEENEDEDEECANVMYNNNQFGQDPYNQNFALQNQAANFGFQQMNQGFGFGQSYPNYGNQQQFNRNLTVTGNAMSMFRIGIRMGWQGLLYLLIDKNYDYMLAMEDALSEAKYQLLLNLLKKTSKDSVVQHFNSKHQNLMHTLAMHGGNASHQQLNAIYSQFLKRGVEHMAVDIYGRTALHYAVIAKNYTMTNILLNSKYDPNLEDKERETPLSLLIKGNGIAGYETILKALLFAGANLNIKYKETYYNKVHQGDIVLKEEYFTTPLIHLVRYILTKSPFGRNIWELLRNFLERGADTMLLDSDGRDIFIYTALENSREMLEYLIKYTRNHNPKAVDRFGKTAMHYAVRQYEIGSYQNVEILEIFIESNFEYQIPDSEGLTPVHYAAAQSNGRMAKIFKKHKIAVPQMAGVKWPPNIRKIENWPLEVNFHEDAEKYLKQVEDILENEVEKPKAKVDSIGNEGEPLEVVYDDNKEPYDAYMNKVDLKNGLYGQYVFYRMQLIRNTNRDVYIVYTRWGRIGEDGMFQKTPFGSLEEATEDFAKVFKSKTGNDWAKRSDFHKQRKKYVLMAIKEKFLHYKQLIKPIDFKHMKVKTQLSKPIKKLMKAILNVSIYEQAMSGYGLDIEALPVSKLKKETLKECQDLLESMKGIVKSIEAERVKGLEAKAEILEDLYNQINDISSRYYEIIPQSQYKTSRPPPLSSQEQINTQFTLIEDLINIEAASKILLAAQSKMNEINPLDYCLKALGVDLEVIQQFTQEYDIIKKYIDRSSNEDDGYQHMNLKNIFRLQRRGENERFIPYIGMENRWLLFHGSKTSNFIGILSQGLRIAPPNAAITGWAFGKGIYFADMFAKSAGYCYTYQPGKGDLLMLICEVALGKMSNVTAATFTNEAAPAGYDSIRARGARGPNMDKKLYLEDGSQIPFGEIQNNRDDPRGSYLAHNEYVIFNQEQVKMRYLIQWTQKNNC